MPVSGIGLTQKAGLPRETGLLLAWVSRRAAWAALLNPDLTNEPWLAPSLIL